VVLGLILECSTRSSIYFCVGKCNAGGERSELYDIRSYVSGIGVQFPRLCQAFLWVDLALERSVECKMGILLKYKNTKTPSIQNY
jgi:hypothetical protein